MERKGKPKTSRCLYFSILLLMASIFVLCARPTAAQVGPYAEGPEVPAWMAERARRSRMGRRERVRIPLVRRSDGWGCVCPEYYIGLSTGVTGSTTWTEPRFERARLRPRKNMIVLAEGYFTGRRLRRDLRSHPEEPEELIFQLWEFRVTRVHLLPESHQFYDEEAPENHVAVLRTSSVKKHKSR